MPPAQHPSVDFVMQPVAGGDGWAATENQKSPGPPSVTSCAHRGVSVAVMLSGAFRYRSPHVDRLLTPGTVLLAGAGDEFVCEHQNGTGHHALVYDFSADYFERLTGEAAPAPLAARAFTLDTADAGLLVDVAHGLRRPDALQLEEFGLRLGFAGLRAQPAGGSRPISPRDHRRIADSIHFIEEHYAEPLTLDLIAANAGLSTFHFVRVFRALVNATPWEFLVRTRLRAAALRLRSCGDAVTSIAMAVGFGDLSNFTRRFGEMFGYAPQAYRQRNRRN